MDKQFWLDKWDKNEIGFHQEEYNPHMVSYFNRYANKSKSVFIPLAGKTKDICWFLENGFHVIAVEIAEKAVKDFFNENNIKYNLNKNIYKSENLTFIQDDIFNIPLDLEFDFIYDRASLIALPPKLRQKLIVLYKNFINRGTTLLSLIIEYNTQVMEGPPFSISYDDFQKYFNEYQIDLIQNNKYTMQREQEININQNVITVRTK